MSAHLEALNVALALQQAGRLSEAEAVCRRVLAAEPSNAQGWYVLGSIACHAGQFEAAAECLARAVSLAPDFAEAHCNLGTALQELRRLAEAIQHFQRAVALEPRFAEAHFNLGNALRLAGQLDEALVAYEASLALKPDLADALSNMGSIYCERGQWEEAAYTYQRAIELAPDFAEAHNGLGNALQRQGKLEASIACYRRALRLRPDFAVALNNLGSALLAQAQQGQADRGPDSHSPFDAAVACARQALALKPDFAEAHHNLGLVGVARLNLEEALACYERAVAVKPDFAEAHFSLATLLLLTGDFARGWQEYEWRFRLEPAHLRTFPAPEWSGEPLGGRTILVHCEQGFGDTFQFIRYCQELKQRGATVLVECPRALVNLLETAPGIDQLVGSGEAPPAYDVHASLLSVPRILGTTLESIPASVPYLSAAPALESQWRQKLHHWPGFRVGINWRGRSGTGPHRARDIPLAWFAALAKVPGVRLISLQRGEGREEALEAASASWLVELGDAIDTASGAFTDTAAITKNLDLVITSDTAIAHLAGALAVPVWVALPLVPDWRWLLGRSDSPWYPTMRLFRQHERGDWAGVFAEIEAALRELVATQDRAAARP